MPSQFMEMSDAETWAILVGAAKKAAQEKGYCLKRVPGRGRSNVWTLEKSSKELRASIRTSKDRWIAFPPLNGGKKWKTLDTVDMVLVGVVDQRDDPSNVEVYELDAKEVRRRFDAAYAARRAAGQTIQDNFGMWVGLDVDTRGIPASVGSGIAEKHKPIAIYPMNTLLEARRETAGEYSDVESDAFPGQGSASTIGEVMAQARKRISELAGVDAAAVKLDLKIEY
jgi:hypothetical protein